MKFSISTVSGLLARVLLAASAPLLKDYNTGGSTSTTSINNSIGVRLTPATTAMDAANEVMAIDSSLPDAASGVGIQQGWGSSSQTPTLFDFNAEKTIQFAKTRDPTILIPLAIRMIFPLLARRMAKWHSA